MITNTSRQPQIALAGMLVIASLTMVLFASPVAWYGQKLLSDPFKGVALLCLVVSLLLRIKSLPGLQPNFTILPTLLFWLSIILYLLNENRLGIHIFSATLCIIAIYSLLGVVVSRKLWKRLLMPFGLIILMLPFEGYLDIYIGFPLRLFCAERAREILQMIGYSSISQESIILIEGKAANVELACSGIKGLWAGGIFFLLLTIVENYRISLRWFLVGTTMIGLLLAANVFRITILVFLSLVLEMPAFADLIHLALGLLGFSLSCVFTWGIAQVVCHRSEKDLVQVGNKVHHPQYLFLAVFIGCILVALWLHQPYRPMATPRSLDLHFPEKFRSEQVGLTRVESDFFRNNNAVTRKFSFNCGELSGSAIIVLSNYWKGQHDPRNCYKGQGHSIRFEGTWLLANNSFVRFLQIDGGKTAIYWFQSSEKITADYTSRVFNGIIHPHETWLLVSTLWEQEVNKEEIQDLLLLIQSGLAEQIRYGERDDKEQ